MAPAQLGTIPWTPPASARLSSSGSLPVYLIPGFLSAAECEALIASADGLPVVPYEDEVPRS